jgi:hypothetical protein
MTSYVTSADGTRIAFDRVGRGSPVVVVSGIFCDIGRRRANWPSSSRSSSA